MAREKGKGSREQCCGSGMIFFFFSDPCPVPDPTFQKVSDPIPDLYPDPDPDPSPDPDPV
jgi:hypothetical protein